MSALLQSEHWVSRHVKQELEELPEHSFAQNRRPQSTCVPRQEAQVDGTFKSIRQSETHAAFVSFSEHCCAQVCKLFWLSDRQLPSANGRLAITTTKTRPNIMALVRSWHDNLLELGNNCTQKDSPISHVAMLSIESEPPRLCNSAGTTGMHTLQSEGGRPKQAVELGIEPFCSKKKLSFAGT